MDVKSRRNAERKNKANRKNEFTRVNNCPFCGSVAGTHVSSAGIRFFDCYVCGASVTFKNASAESSLELWEARNDKLWK